MEVVQYKNLQFQVWDLGGQNSIRYQNSNSDNIGKCITQIPTPSSTWSIATINNAFQKQQNSFQKFYKFIDQYSERNITRSTTIGFSQQTRSSR